jgi:hypothetical protein
MLLLTAKAMAKDFGFTERAVIVLSILINLWAVWTIIHMGIYIGCDGLEPTTLPCPP